VTSLFDPLDVGAVRLANRVLMAPLTRMRASQPGDLPNDLMTQYYRQRASAGLIISEGTQISTEGKGYLDTPGIHSIEQIARWRLITDAVHAEGGLIAAQLWHTGRVNHESLHAEGEWPVSASAVAVRTRTTISDGQGGLARANVPVPRALATDEIARVVADYAHATACAREAGFDLVEIHAAHGYLLHQFLSADSNHRTDAYGGSLDNRLRLLSEVVDASVAAWSADRVGVRFSPVGSFNGLEDPDGAATGLAVARALRARDLAFLHLSEPDWAGGPVLDDDYRGALREAYDGVIIGAGNYDVAKAQRLLDAGFIDAAAFGRTFIANPDLPRRLRDGLPLNPQRVERFYGGDGTGYTDYPAYDA
jgi:N-ethylmaleimide reductase